MGKRRISRIALHHPTAARNTRTLNHIHLRHLRSLVPAIVPVPGHVLKGKRVNALKKERNMGIDCMLCMNTWSCEDNSKYKFTNKSGRKLSCAKIAKSNNRERYCKKDEKIRKNCADTCEQCCSDDVRKVLFTENLVEVTCGMLGMREDKFARCEDPEIASTCKKTCGTPPCANDDD